MILHSKKDLLPDLGFLNISPPRPPPPRKKKRNKGSLKKWLVLSLGRQEIVNLKFLFQIKEELRNWHTDTKSHSYFERASPGQIQTI